MLGMLGFSICILCIIGVALGAPVNQPTHAPTHEPTMAPTQAPTAYGSPVDGAIYPAAIYGLFIGIGVIFWMLAEFTARIKMTFKKKVGSVALEVDEEEMNPDYKLHSYLLSILNMDHGVFSDKTSIVRWWHELMCNHAYLSIFNMEVNGPSFSNYESTEDDEYEQSSLSGQSMSRFV